MLKNSQQIGQANNEKERNKVVNSAKKNEENPIVDENEGKLLPPVKLQKKHDDDDEIFQKHWKKIIAAYNKKFATDKVAEKTKELSFPTVAEAEAFFTERAKENLFFVMVEMKLNKETGQYEQGELVVSCGDGSLHKGSPNQVLAELRKSKDPGSSNSRYHEAAITIVQDYANRALKEGLKNIKGKSDENLSDKKEDVTPNAGMM